MSDTANPVRTSTAGPAGLRRRRRALRTVLRLGALGLALLALAACNEIVVDYPTRAVTSKAVASVAPTAMTVGGSSVAAIDITLTDCHRFRIQRVPSTRGTTTIDSARTRPTAIIRDRTGRVVFDSYASATYPGGAVATLGTDTDHLRIPVAGFATPLQIEAGCTTSTGKAPTSALTWYFGVCVTSTRTCPATTTGHLVLDPDGWIWHR